MRRRPTTSTLSAPRRRAGDSGVFWRSPRRRRSARRWRWPGKGWGWPPTRARAPASIVTAWARTKGSWLQGGSARERSARTPPTCPSRCRWRSPTATRSDPPGCCGTMRCQGMSRRTIRSSILVLTMPPRRFWPSSSSSMVPLPSSVAGARRNSFTPKWTISSRTKLSQRSASSRPCCGAMSAVAGDEAGMDAPHRGPADDVEVDLPAEVAGQLLADVAQDTRLVGAAGAAAGQHQGQPGAITALSGPRWRAHPISSGYSSRSPKQVRRSVRRESAQRASEKNGHVAGACAEFGDPTLYRHQTRLCYHPRLCLFTVAGFGGGRSLRCSPSLRGSPPSSACPTTSHTNRIRKIAIGR